MLLYHNVLKRIFKKVLIKIHPCLLERAAHYRTVLIVFLKKVFWKIHPDLTEKVVGYKGQIFSIGIYEGKDLSSLENAISVVNPVFSANDIKDVPAAFVADPFVIHVGSRLYMFFEVFNKVTHLGEIGVATSVDGLKWSYGGIVLKEPFHLSYPYVFQWDKDFYMIPENKSKGVRLFKARPFPHHWEFISMMLDGDSFVDSSIFYFKDKWWLFTAKFQKATDPYPLFLYYADKPVGPWREHSENPIVVNNNTSRPAGKVLLINGRPTRFAQDCMPIHGSSVRAFEVLELSATTYIEHELNAEPILSGGNEPWNIGGIHHIDAHSMPGGGWRAYVDGWYMGRCQKYK